MFGREPVVIAAAVRAVILCATAFGLQWTADQVAAVMLAVETILAVATRQSVTSPATLADAGLTKAGVVASGQSARDERR